MRDKTVQLKSDTVPHLNKAKSLFYRLHPDVTKATDDQVIRAALKVYGGANEQAE